jgi:RNA polymerase sigma-70 factor (ECF subfamily)
VEVKSWLLTANGMEPVKEDIMQWITGPGTFEDKMLPHLNAAYTLARWLTGNVQDAEDAVQEAYLRALRFFDDCRGGDGRAWLLQIVRNTCYTQLRKKIPHLLDSAFDEELHSQECVVETAEAIAIAHADSQIVRSAMEELPVRYREILILRELEGMSYSEMGKILNQSLGGIRTTLFRARQHLKKRLLEQNSVTTRALGRLPAAVGIE